MRHVTLQALPGTAFEHGLSRHFPADIVHPSLTPDLVKPVFQLPGDLELVEAVAVAYRDISGKSVDGGFFGYSPEGEVVRMALVDAQRGINTDADPAWVAFGLNMSVGKLLVRGDDGVRELPWSIVDFGLHRPTDTERNPTPARLAVRAAFLSNRAN
jgi:hypothetical protein